MSCIKTFSKNLVLLMVVLLVFDTAEAQKTKTLTRLYLQLGAGAGIYRHENSDINVQAVFKNKWSATAAYQSLDMRPANKPGDYIPASEEGLLLGIPYATTHHLEKVEMKIVSITGGRHFLIGKKGWATTEAGICLGNGEKMKFKPIPRETNSSSGFLGWTSETSSNYETTIENKTIIGASLKADINYAIASFLGIGLGMYAHINSVQSPVGMELKLMLGFMGR